MDNSRVPYFSVIIPVLHEESVINTCIEHILRLQTDLSLEILVVAPYTDDRTLVAIKHTNVITLCGQENIFGLRYRSLRY